MRWTYLPTEEKEIKLQLENNPTGWMNEWAYWHEVKVSILPLSKKKKTSAKEQSQGNLYFRQAQSWADEARAPGWKHDPCQALERVRLAYRGDRSRGRGIPERCLRFGGCRHHRDLLHGARWTAFSTPSSRNLMLS